ncbi:DUF1289 domain-containing protein [uncultured Sphingomonas sp.]|uniref:DUF1289 domain-containing protein n=1 Tax=uncultured Sphingomonas sp. TaxID=158754 RepID=UPI0035CB06B7
MERPRPRLPPRRLHRLSTPAPAPVASPCVGRCRIDEAGLCEGCARTLDEIARWGGVTPAERERIIRALPSRSS